MMNRLNALRVDTDPLAPALNRVELDIPINKCKDGVIASQSDTLSGLEFGTTLADDDVTRSYLLTTELFDA